MEQKDKTPHGDPIHRHTESIHEDFVSASGQSHIEDISDHIERFVGPIETVFHEVVSHLVHIDIYYVKPSTKLPYHIFITSGMSDLPMRVPEGLEEHRYSELCILLPHYWPIAADTYKTTEEVFKDENSYWPIRWLTKLARFPHEYDTWLGWGHTVPNGEEVDPFSENTKLGCLMLLPPFELPREFFELQIEDNNVIRFYCLNALYKEEMDYKLEHGCDKLLKKFDKYDISSVIDINRRNVCLKTNFLARWQKKGGS